jgi:hypothetical protein
MRNSSEPEIEQECARVLAEQVRIPSSHREVADFDPLLLAKPPPICERGISGCLS